MGGSTALSDRKQSPLSRRSNASISKGMFRSGSLSSARMRATPSRTDAAA